MNQGWLTPLSEPLISAVPVLPANGTLPLTVRPAAVPWGSWVTWVIMVVSSVAVCGLIAVDCTCGRASGSPARRDR